ncbi:E3 ubiquitin-protein ligase RBBP6 isoform X2 [Drosophila teissieri]|uniref:E3 ubiquitin-protein ligase RBBP6 isoform X2 n=1 Tax=Drosophila teissieri TaxID=7243 RepID=UPI001CBA008E|nr:E3 ubiquitin-protein ligase RBBP6 isoform X2 [Drosophila teissieri]
MSFTLTNQSLIRLESSKDADAWNRTLMFFNVDISGGVCRDHRNQITLPRTSAGHGKRRAPGGGLSNPITESAMSFGAPNKFHTHGHSDLDHRNYSPRTSGRRRDNFAYSDRHRHFHYGPIKPGRSRAEMGLVSPSPSADSADYYASKRIHFPDFETEKTYGNYYPDASYEMEEDEPYRVVPNTDYPKEKDPRINNEYESPFDYPSGRRLTNGHHRKSERDYRYLLPKHPTQDDYYRDVRGTLPRHFRSSSYRMKPNYRQASGSLPPNYASNYYAGDSTEYRSDDDYDGNPENYKNYREYYEEPTREAYQKPYEEYHDYEYPDYRENSKAYPTPFPKPLHQYYKKGHSQSYPTKIYKPESVSKVSEVKESPFAHIETHHVKSNRSKRNNQPEEIPRRKGFKHFREKREEPINYEEISSDIFRLTQPKKYASKVQDDRFNVEENSQRASENRYKLPSYAERSLSSTHKKIFKEELPHRYRPKKVIDEIPKPHRSLRTETFGQNEKSNGENSSYKRRSHKAAPDRKKSVDFVRFTDCNDGSEIPHRIRESGQSPSSIFFTIEIPYKKKQRRHTYSQKGEYIPERSHSGCDNFADKSFRPQTSLYDVGKDRKRKTMKQKISGFFKRSKLRLSKSNIFRNKSKVLKSCKTGQPNPNLNQRSEFILNSPVASDHSLGYENVEVPSQDSEPQGYGLKRGKECHYPTVYRGTHNQLPENNTEIFHQYSMYNVLSSTNQRSKANC